MNTTTAPAGLIPVIFSRPVYGKGGRFQVSTERRGHFATDATDGRTICGVAMDAPVVSNVRVMPFNRSVECVTCKLRAR
jgi:hypothetical protein